MRWIWDGYGWGGLICWCVMRRRAGWTWYSVDSDWFGSVDEMVGGENGIGWCDGWWVVYMSVRAAEALMTGAVGWVGMRLDEMR